MKQKYSVLTFLLGFILIASQSCYYDVEETLYPTDGNSCDTTAVSFSASIVNIMETSCYACHSDIAAPLAGGSIFLEGYDNLLAVVNADKLLCSMEHTGNCSTMPPNSSPINSCDIDKVRAWINSGSPNN
ncbi:MAG: hypothetical protein ACPG5B_14185 [Chitinophagales bacterium]